MKGRKKENARVAEKLEISRWQVRASMRDYEAERQLPESGGSFDYAIL